MKRPNFIKYEEFFNVHMHFILIQTIYRNET
jgi:hypothetical protein